VSLEGGVVKYQKNGTIFYTSTVTPTYPLLVDSALYSTGATLNNEVVSGNWRTPQNTTWTNAQGVSVSGNSITKTASTAWGNAGAASTQTIASGDGYVETTATETNTARMFGFSHVDADQNYTSIQFGLHLDLSGVIYVFESGSNRGTFGAYATGDKLRVSLEGGVVKYQKNGTTFYTSTVTPTYPLLVDSALYSTGATLNNAVVSQSGSSSANINYLVSDQLGTPRMVFDQSGALATTKRHDYAPFGEELFNGARTTAMGYAAGDLTRQKFTSKERDGETGLDYFGARYYASSLGRFAGADPLLSSAHPSDPQSWNRFFYAANNPLKYIDPLGLYIFDRTVTPDQQDAFNAAIEQARTSLKAYGAKYGTNSKEYKKAARALEVYGEKGVNNGVTVGAREGVGEGRVRPGRSKQIHIDFDPDAFKTKEFGDAIGHEGSHAADKREWINSGFKDAKDPTIYQTEFDAYTVSGVLAQARHMNEPGDTRTFVTLPDFFVPGKSGRNPSIYVHTELDLWNSAWAPADIATMRGKSIDKVLERPKDAGGLYEVTPKNQGGRAF
jgi:RHS repeat-associated protein